MACAGSLSENASQKQGGLGASQNHAWRGTDAARALIFFLILIPGFIDLDYACGLRWGHGREIDCPAPENFGALIHQCGKTPM
jgi:hypothetical protein